MAAGPPGAAASAGLFLVPQAQVATDALAWLCRTSASDWSDWPFGESDRQRPSAASPRRAQAHGGRGAAPGQSPSEGKACELEPKPVPAQTGQGLRQPPCAWPPALPPTRSAARSSLQDETTRPWRETMETMSRFAKNKVLGRGTAAASSRETQRHRETENDRRTGRSEHDRRTGRSEHDGQGGRSTAHTCPAPPHFPRRLGLGTHGLGPPSGGPVVSTKQSPPRRCPPSAGTPQPPLPLAGGSPGTPLREAALGARGREGQLCGAPPTQGRAA